MALYGSRSNFLMFGPMRRKKRTIGLRFFANVESLLKELDQSELDSHVGISAILDGFENIGLGSHFELFTWSRRIGLDSKRLELTICEWK